VGQAGDVVRLSSSLVGLNHQLMSGSLYLMGRVEKSMLWRALNLRPADIEGKYF
jgi:hypothetical protein